MGDLTFITIFVQKKMFVPSINTKIKKIYATGLLNTLIYKILYLYLTNYSGYSHNRKA